MSQKTVARLAGRLPRQSIERNPTGRPTVTGTGFTTSEYSARAADSDRRSAAQVGWHCTQPGLLRPLPLSCLRLAASGAAAGRHRDSAG